MKIGLALSGGGVRGIAHAGAIKALEENNIKIDLIGGTSAGSLVASLFAIGYKPDEIYDLFKQYARTLLRLDSNKIKNEIKNFIFNKRIQSKGINSGEYTEEIFNTLAKEKHITNMSDIKMPLIIPTVNINKSEEYIFTSVDISKKNYISDISIGKAVRASSSLPLVYMPLEYKGDLFMDGGILDNIPTKEVKKLGADKVISIKFDSDTVDENSNAMDIVMKVADIMGSKISEESLKESDYVVTIPTDGTGILDINKIDYCYKSGYDTMQGEIKEIMKVLK